MRILANYGYKTNGDTYTVTFETMGDVPSAQASQTVDELFRLAKEAVQRQLAGVKPSAQPATTVTVPQPALPRTEGARHEVSRVEGPVATPPAAPVNGNGRKPQIKDPGLPATSKQVGLLRRLARQKGRPIGDFTDMTMGEASSKIDELMAA